MLRALPILLVAAVGLDGPLAISQAPSPAPAASVAPPPAPPPAQVQVRPFRVAVLGDAAASTRGPESRLDAWPDQLARLLGPGTVVRGFSRQGASLDTSARRAIQTFPEWGWVRDFRPDLVVLVLGSSDAADASFSAGDRLPAGIAATLDGLAGLPSAPRLLVCLPPPAAPAWPRAASYSTNVAVVADALRAAATARGIPVVDLAAVLAGHPETLGDGVVTDVAGSALIADSVASAVRDAGMPASAVERSDGRFRPSTAPPAGLAVSSLLAEGKPAGLTNSQFWKEVPGALRNTGNFPPIVAPLAIGEGPFSVTLEMRILGGEEDAPRISLGDQFVLLETTRSELAFDGSLFRGMVRMAPAGELWKRGDWTKVELRRVLHDLEIWMNDVFVYAVPAPDRTFANVAVHPRSGQVEIRRFDIARPADTALAAIPAATDLGVPTLDTAGRDDLHVVVDRQAGQYLGHPSTVLLEDGRTMFVAYPQGHGKGPIVLRRSDDGGRTWSEPLDVPENWATSQETPTLARLVDPATGRRRIVLFSGLYPARRAISDDDGRTWSPLEPMGDWGGIVVMSSVMQRADGVAIAYFHDDGRFLAKDGQARGVSTIYESRSLDGGASWTPPKAIHARTDAFLCEPGVIASPDGSRWAMLLRENSRQRNSFVSFSDDRGETWTPPRTVPAALTGDRHVGMSLPDGRMVVTFRDMAKDSPTYGDWVAWVGTWKDLEQGQPGIARIRLMDNLPAAGGTSTDCGYAGLSRLADGTFVLVSYGHWTEGEQPYLVAVRLPAELLPTR